MTISEMNCTRRKMKRTRHQGTHDEETDNALIDEPSEYEKKMSRFRNIAIVIMGFCAISIFNGTSFVSIFWGKEVVNKMSMSQIEVPELLNDSHPEAEFDSRNDTNAIPLLTHTQSPPEPHPTRLLREPKFTANKNGLNNVIQRLRDQIYQPGVDIALDPSSSIHSDIMSIRHFPEFAKIEVTLRPGSRCPRPVLRGRISGKSLALIKWDPEPAHFSSSDPVFRPTVTSGYYRVPYKIKYFLEIVILYCHAFDESNPATTLHSNCLEPAPFHRLTAPNTKIHVIKASRELLNVGFWSSKVRQPLYTRYQPIDCDKPGAAGTQRCASQSDTPNQLEYKFHWGGVKMPELPPASSLLATNDMNCRYQNVPCQMCIIGASHSHRIWSHMKQIVDHNVGYFKFTYPEDITQHDVRDIINRCPIILIGLGQWSASHYRGDSPEDFGRGMDYLLQQFQGFPHLYVRDVHYNPLGARKQECPPTDLRTPVVIDRYNEVLRAVCSRMGIPFLDTSFIIGPVWDQGSDWVHYDTFVNVVEAQYIANYFRLLR